MNRWLFGLSLVLTLAAVTLGARYFVQCDSTMVVMVNVTTDPAGATVSLNGEQIPSLTPIRNHTFTLTEANQVTVLVQKAGYLPWQRSVKPGELASLAERPIALEPEGKVGQPQATPAPPLKISITSRPLGASVTVDGAAVGLTPVAGFEVAREGAPLAISLVAQGYKPISLRRERSSLRDGEEISLPLELEVRPPVEPVTKPAEPGPVAPPTQPAAPTPMRVLVVSNPLGAAVSVDGQATCTSPCEVQVRPRAKATVELNLKGHKPQRRQLTWKATEAAATESFELVPLDPVQVEVLSSPPGALVAVDGAPVGKAPVKVVVPWGRQVVVTASLEGHTTARQELDFDAATRSKRLTLKLAPLPKIKLSVKSTPPGAKVSLGGVALGVTPIKDKLVARTGVAPLEVTAPGMEPWSTDLDLMALGDTHTVEVSLKRSAVKRGVDISSTPPGAQISVDGRVIGKTPMKVELQLTDADQLSLSLSLAGYLAHTRTISRGELAAQGPLQITLEKPTQDPSQCEGAQGEDWLARAMSQKLSRDTQIALRDCFTRTRNWPAAIKLGERIVADPVWASSGIDHYAMAVAWSNSARKPEDFLRCASEAEDAIDSPTTLSKCDLIGAHYLRAACLNRYLSRSASLEVVETQARLVTAVRSVENTLLSEDLDRLPDRERACFERVQQDITTIQAAIKDLE